MDTKKLIEEVLRIGTQVRVSEPKKGDSRKNPFLTFCDPHGASSDPFGVAICMELSLICHHSKNYNKFVFNDIRNFCKKYRQFVKYQVVTHW